MHGRVVINVQQILSKERTITNVSYRKADASSKAASFGVLTTDCVDQIGEVADGNAVVPMERKENATFLLAKHETAWRRRMQSPACGTGARRHGHQISADRVQDEKKTSASMRGRQMRQRDAGRMVLVSSAKKEKLHPSKKQLQVWVRHQAERRCHSRPHTTLWHRTWSHPQNWQSPSPPTFTLPTRLVAADEQSTKGRECAALEINVWNEREVVRATKDALNITMAKESEG